MNVDECIKKLDRLEINRKADYSIWGYLYQFDLTLYDMLCHNTKNDLFNDLVKDSQANYQIEVIEDYLKTYTLLQKDYVRIAQVKYSTTSSSFNYWSVIVDLYYDYLYVSNLTEGDIDIKCGLFFNVAKEIIIDKLDIIKNGRKTIENFILICVEEAALSENDTGDNSSTDNHTKRVIDVIKTYHTNDTLNEFLNNSLIINWKENRSNLIKLIKSELYNEFNAEYLNFTDYDKKDILYSLAINYVINEWQSKKKKKDIIKITTTDVIQYIKQVCSNEENTIFNLISVNIRMAIDRNIDEIISNLNDEGMEDEEINKLLNNSYYKYCDNLFEQLQLMLKDKLNRYKLLNTISLKEYITKEEYYGLSLSEEYGYFSRKQSYLESYIKRILNFINYNVNFKLYDVMNINIMLNFKNEILLFEHPSEKRTCILLPKTYDNPKYEHKMILDRINNSSIKPKVWYFDKVNVKNPIYDLNICKPEQTDVDIKEPYDNHYYIECMECLEENIAFDDSKISCIFSGRCNRNGQAKNRETID